jgi:hypothetical protein
MILSVPYSGTGMQHKGHKHQHMEENRDWVSIALKSGHNLLRDAENRLRTSCAIAADTRE